MKYDSLKHRRDIQIIASLSYCAVVLIVWYFLPMPVIAIALGFLPIVLFLALRNPFLVCMFFILFTFFRFHEFIPLLIPLHLPQILALGMFAVLGIYLITNQIELYWKPQLTLFILFSFIVTISVAMAVNRQLAWAAYSGSYIKIVLVVFAIAWLARSPKDFNLAGRLFVIAGIIIGCVALYNRIKGISLVEGSRVTIGLEIGSLLGDPNDLALVLLLPVGFALSFLLTNGVGAFNRVTGFICISIVLLAIIATQSRGGILGVFAILAYFTYRKMKSKVLFFTIMSIAVIAILAAAGLEERVSGGAREPLLDESMMGRLYAWQTALNMAIRNPITGVGINNFVANYFEYTSHWQNLLYAVHSTWFEVLAETGFIGFMVFIILVIMTLAQSNKTVKSLTPSQGSKISKQPIVYSAAQGNFAGLIGFCVAGSFLSQAFTWPFYIFLGLSIALQKYTEELNKRF